jgi:hypothetical protein
MGKADVDSCARQGRKPYSQPDIANDVLRQQRAIIAA